MSDNNEKTYTNESLLATWGFRICSLFVIILFCFLIIKFYFNDLKKNKTTQENAERMLTEISNSTENINNAWRTMYYFYQTGDLMNIIKCPTRTHNLKTYQENTLLTLYREDIETNKNANSNEDGFGMSKNIVCGGKVNLEIGLKDEIYKHPKDFRNYTFKLGEEPLELIEKYPFVKDALTKISEGERATFVALLAENKKFKLKKQTIYEIRIPKNNENQTTILPLYSVIRKNTEKFIVNNHANCGAVVSFLYQIHDIDGTILDGSNSAIKVKLGSGQFNKDVEQVMIQMQIGDRYKILLTKHNFKESEFIKKQIFSNRDIIIVDVVILNVQK